MIYSPIQALVDAGIRDTLTFAHLEGWWTDAGTFDSLLRATNLVAANGRTKANGVSNHAVV
jgi:dTDP-glucose pyrophosphorylase